MSSRLIESCSNNNYILKKIDNVPSKLKDNSINQSLTEIQIWNNASEEERELLAPLIHYFFDENDLPVLIFPRFKPLLSEEEMSYLPSELVLCKLYSILQDKGLCSADAYSFIQKVIRFCENQGINEDDILNNLNNLGWNKDYGVRIIDYGLDDEMIERMI